MKKLVTAAMIEANKPQRRIAGLEPVEEQTGQSHPETSANSVRQEYQAEQRRQPNSTGVSLLFAEAPR